MPLLILMMFVMALTTANLTASIYLKSPASPDSPVVQTEISQAQRTVEEYDKAAASFESVNLGRVPDSEAVLFDAHGFTPRAVAEHRSRLDANGRICFEPVHQTAAALASELGGTVGIEPSCVPGKSTGNGTVWFALQGATLATQGQQVSGQAPDFPGEGHGPDSHATLPCFAAAGHAPGVDCEYPAHPAKGPSVPGGK